MYTITALARNANLPRRTVQYWHDQGILRPLSRDPVVYSDDELKLTRLLAPFGRMPAQIGVIRELGRIFRLIMEGSASAPNSVAQAYAAANSGKPAYLIIAPALMANGEDVWAWTRGAQSLGEATKAVRDILEHDPLLAVTVVDLGFALDTRLGAGTIYFEENA